MRNDGVRDPARLLSNMCEDKRCNTLTERSIDSGCRHAGLTSPRGEQSINCLQEVGRAPFIAFGADLQAGQLPVASMIAVQRLCAISLSPGW